MLAAARLTLRCIFQDHSEISDGGGGVTATWQDRFTRRGALAFANLTAQLEAIQQGEMTSRTRATLTVREDPDTRTLTPAFRVRIEEDGFQAGIWNIRDITRPEAGLLRMTVEAGSAA